MRERRRDAVGEPRVTAGGRRAGVWRSPRTWVAIGTAIVAGSALMVSGSASASTGGNVNAKGVLKYGVDLNDTFSNTFDPAASTDDCSYAVYTGVFDSLLSPSNTKVNPLLAASYTATPTSITFHLQPGATFSNGDPVTAATVQASIEHIKTSPFRFSLTYIQSIQQVNPQTITFTLNKPVAGDVLWAMTYIDGMQLDPSALPTTSTVPAASGPFTLVNYQQGSSILLKANPSYWGKSAYKLGGVDFVQVSPGPQEVSALETGAVDMLPIQPEDYAAVKSLPNVGIATTQSEDYLVMQSRQNCGAVQRPQGAGGHGVRRRPQGHQPGRLLRSGPAGVPTLPHRDRRLQQDRRQQVQLPTGQGQGHAGRRRPSPRDQLQPRHPLGLGDLQPDGADPAGGDGPGRIQR